MKDQELRFSGSVPGSYDRRMVPLLFRPYAQALARRAQALGATRILETAAGTGIVTKALSDALPDARIIATDLNPPMLDIAQQHVSSPNVNFRQADALELPFDEGAFDLVVCQFGAMFFPDKVQGHAEAYRVLEAGGHYLLAIWDRIERNPLSEVAQRTLVEAFPDDPPLFMRDGPFGYHDPAAIAGDLKEAGFAQVAIETVELRSKSPSAHDAAAALCYGTPMGVEIEERAPGSLDRIFEKVSTAFKAFDKGSGVDAPMSAHLVTATR